MNTNYSKIEAIKQRKSVRTFSSEALTPEHVADIKSYLKHIVYEMGPFGHRMEFHYSRVSNNITSKGERIGTYGVIKYPSAYIISVCKNTREHLLDLGYIFEKIVIYLKHMGVDSCWLGGTFSRQVFLEKYDVRRHKIIPAVLPIGYGRDNKRFLENAMRKMVKADMRQPWEAMFFEKNFDKSLSRDVAGDYAEVFEMVRLGPSASNKQPWRLVFNPETSEVHFYLAHTPNYGNGKLNFDMQFIDMGIAMYHFESTATELGHDIKWVHENAPEGISLPEHHEYICTALVSKY